MVSARTSLKMLRAAIAFAALFSVASALAYNFPALTGRIVDQANIIPADTQATILPKLVDLEQKSGIQLVVATVSSLEGQAIEPYANELFRTWQLGEKTKNNGVLLLVAPNEHRVRIEVGYGLEGTLTDALSSVIINNTIVPKFKTGDFAGGISDGVDAIIAVLTTDSSEWQAKPPVRLDHQQSPDPFTWVLIAILIAVIFGSIISPGFRWVVLNILLNVAFSSGGSGRSSDGFGGGGFSGGGGSSGGGGASGSW